MGVIVFSFAKYEGFAFDEHGWSAFVVGVIDGSVDIFQERLG